MGLGGVPVPKPIGNRSRRNKRWSREVENNLARKIEATGMSARRVPLSGAVKNAGLDGDIQASWFLAEAKARTPEQLSTGESIRIPLKWWTKVKAEAETAGKPALLIVHPKGATSNFVVADFDTFMTLLGKAARALGEESELPVSARLGAV